MGSPHDEGPYDQSAKSGHSLVSALGLDSIPARLQSRGVPQVRSGIEHYHLPTQPSSSMAPSEVRSSTEHYHIPVPPSSSVPGPPPEDTQSDQRPREEPPPPPPFPRAVPVAGEGARKRTRVAAIPEQHLHPYVFVTNHSLIPQLIADLREQPEGALVFSYLHVEIVAEFGKVLHF